MSDLIRGTIKRPEAEESVFGLSLAVMALFLARRVGATDSLFFIFLGKRLMSCCIRGSSMKLPINGLKFDDFLVELSPFIFVIVL